MSSPNIASSGWNKLDEIKPKSGQDVIAFYRDDIFNVNSEFFATYCEKGYVLRDEVRLTREGLRQLVNENPDLRKYVIPNDIVATRTLMLVFGHIGEFAVKEPGFYLFECNAHTGLMEWRKHADIVTHWMPKPAAPEGYPDDGLDDNDDETNDSGSERINEC